MNFVHSTNFVPSRENSYFLSILKIFLKFLSRTNNISFLYVHPLADFDGWGPSALTGSCSQFYYCEKTPDETLNSAVNVQQISHIL
jgi:hypothetical protein